MQVLQSLATSVTCTGDISCNKPVCRLHEEVGEQVDAPCQAAQLKSRMHAKGLIACLLSCMQYAKILNAPRFLMAKLITGKTICDADGRDAWGHLSQLTSTHLQLIDASKRMIPQQRTQSDEQKTNLTLEHVLCRCIGAE